MNIYDIAEKAGVSVATVSRVINNSANVSEKNRSKVMEIIDQERYVPNIFARNLNSTASKTIDRKSTRLNSSHLKLSRMPSSA